MITALPRPPKTGSKASQKQQARSANWQIADEPFEVIKKAGEQVVGTPPPPPDESKSPHNSPIPQESVLEKKRHSVLAALRQELQEIDELSKKRQEEMRARWQEQERVKKQRQEQIKETQKKSLLEPVAKVKRGILGGMQKIGLKRKQRQVEMAKTPSN